MAKLYFRYGAMGSSKTANAIMVRYNYMERGQKALMLKPAMERRDGEKQVRSRSGLTAPCAYVEELDSIDLGQYDCLSVDFGQYDSFYYAAPPCYMEKGRVIPLAAAVKEQVKIPILCGGRMNDPALAAQAIAEG